jgi:hypothetical protein
VERPRSLSSVQRSGVEDGFRARVWRSRSRAVPRWCSGFCARSRVWEAFLIRFRSWAEPARVRLCCAGSAPKCMASPDGKLTTGRKERGDAWTCALQAKGAPTVATCDKEGAPVPREGALAPPLGHERRHRARRDALERGGGVSGERPIM